MPRLSCAAFQVSPDFRPLRPALVVASWRGFLAQHPSRRGSPWRTSSSVAAFACPASRGLPEPHGRPTHSPCGLRTRVVARDDRSRLVPPARRAASSRRADTSACHLAPSRRRSARVPTRVGAGTWTPSASHVIPAPDERTRGAIAGAVCRGALRGRRRAPRASRWNVLGRAEGAYAPPEG